MIRDRLSRIGPAASVGLVGAALALVLPLTAGAWWQVAVYPQLIDERAVKFTTDTVSYLPIAGGEWVLQPWLVSLLLGFAYEHGGITSLSLIAALLSAGVMITLYLLARAGGAPAGESGAALAGSGAMEVRASRTSAGIARSAAAWAVLAMVPLLWPPTLQSQLFAVLLASLLMLALARGTWWWAPLIIVVWANVHGSTPVALGMVWGAALGLLYPASRAVPQHLRVWQLRYGWAVISSMMMLATPLFVGVIDYMQRVREIPLIDELTPVWSHLDPLSLQGAIVAAGLAVAAATAWKGAIRWRELLPLIALAVLAADSRRNTVWFAVALVPVLARACEVWWASRPHASTFRSVLPRITHPLLGAITVISLALVIVFAPGTERRVDAADRGMPVSMLAKPPWAGNGAPPSDETFVVADAAWADWIYVRLGGGRVAIDARFERFTDDALAAYVRAVTVGDATDDIAPDSCRVDGQGTMIVIDREIAGQDGFPVQPSLATAIKDVDGEYVGSWVREPCARYAEIFTTDGAAATARVF